MLFVLDSNIYILGFGALKKATCETLLNLIASTSSIHSIRTPRLIIEEVRRNLSGEEFKEFIDFLVSLTDIDEDFIVPFELGSKYEMQGLKPADAFIAGYVEWTGADALVTENRHFLSHHSDLPFKVLNAEACLKLIKSS